MFDIGTTLSVNIFLASSPVLDSIPILESLEIVAEEITLLGEADPEKYPIQPKRHSFEFLRDNAHLRMRTATFSAVMRLRHSLAFAVHQFFQY